MIIIKKSGLTIVNPDFFMIYFIITFSPFIIYIPFSNPLVASALSVTVRICMPVIEYTSKAFSFFSVFLMSVVDCGFFMYMFTDFCVPV